MSEKRYKDYRNSAFFLFAHQDDETGVFQLISDELRAGLEVHCFYLTSGSFTGLASRQRNQESLNVLLDLGVKKSNIHFAGSESQIPDCSLVDYLDFVFQYIGSNLKLSSPESRMYIPAWEAGHPDHDALHVAAVAAAKENGFLSRTYQYALYNGYKCFGPVFRVLSPLEENGRIFKTSISVLNRMKFLSYCLRYPSQLKSWIGLFPFFLFHYLFCGYQTWQPVSIKRVFELPHKGELYFVRRGFANKANFYSKINQFLSMHLSA